jgi:Ni,Fe-hydrogenase III large subunit
VRLLSIATALLFLLTACQRYTIGAENAAPRVVSGATEVRRTTQGESASGDATAQASEELPEITSAKQLIEGIFTHVRGSQAVREEAALQLESAQASLQPLSESGTILHWEELEEGFHTAIEKVREGTNDAPNALHRLLEHLDEAAHHE